MALGHRDGAESYSRVPSSPFFLLFLPVPSSFLLLPLPGRPTPLSSTPFRVPTCPDLTRPREGGGESTPSCPMRWPPCFWPASRWRLCAFPPPFTPKWLQTTGRVKPREGRRAREERGRGSQAPGEGAGSARPMPHGSWGKTVASQWQISSKSVSNWLLQGFGTQRADSGQWVPPDGPNGLTHALRAKPL